MKISCLFLHFFILISATSWGQNEEIMIGPGPVPQQPEPIIILDGIRLTSTYIKDILNQENSGSIKTVSIQPDSIFDCNGQLINLGIVKIETKDSLNIAAKKILKSTDNYIYTNPLTDIEINKKLITWDDSTYLKLISLEPEDILSVKINRKKKDECNSTIKIKIRE